MREFLSLGLGAEYRFQCVWVITGIPCFRTYGHRCRGEVLYLFEMKIKFLCEDCKFCHIFLAASGMAAYEIGYYLLVQVFLVVDTVEYTLEFLKQFERRFTHKFQHSV